MRGMPNKQYLSKVVRSEKVLTEEDCLVIDLKKVLILKLVGWG